MFTIKLNSRFVVSFDLVEQNGEELYLIEHGRFKRMFCQDILNVNYVGYVMTDKEFKRFLHWFRKLAYETA